MRHQQPHWTVDGWKARFVRIMTNINNIANSSNPDMKRLGRGARLDAIAAISSGVMNDKEFKPRKRG